MVKIVPTLILMVISFSAFSQSVFVNNRKLDSLKIELYRQNEARKARVDAYLENKSIEMPNGYHLYDIDPLGFPVFKGLHNDQARITTNVNSLTLGELSAYNLEGNGYTVGVWDGGNVLDTHVEFQDRISNQSGAEVNNHATHVTGTIAAAGLNPDAKGMAPKVNIKAYSFRGDDLSEMTNEAANGLVLSNHSYGLQLGWDDSGENWFGGDQDEDYRFGFYTQSHSRVIDEISYNAPYYLIVWSAGNDRDDTGDGTRPPDGPFDSIGPEGSAKNNLTVGAITGFGNYNGPESAVMSGFSSWGPTDDGRIKPDIVGDGVSVLSTSSSGDEEYTSLQGTSMSAPNVTGSLLLLQELYNKTNSKFMRAATLKGLAIHTAREAGNAEGPDYSYGWGILNTTDAAKVIVGANRRINDTTIIEANISNGSTFKKSFMSEPNKSLTVTLSWTDPPGNPVSISINPTDQMLINDLDVRVVDDGGNQISPYILNPTRPSNAATRGNNFRDNIEKVFVSSTESRLYTIEVSHKGSLFNSSQDFSLVITGSEMPGNPNVNLFWQGSNSNWLAANNWKQSNGLNSTTVPKKINNIYFNNKSFNLNNTVRLTQDIEVNNFYAFDQAIGVIDLAGNTIKVNGEFYINNSNLEFKNGTIVLNSTNTERLPFLFIGDASNLSFVIDGNYNLLSDITANKMIFSGGEFFSKSNIFAVSEIEIINQAKSKLIVLEDNLFNNVNRISYDNRNVTFTSINNKYYLADGFEYAGQGIVFTDSLFIGKSSEVEFLGVNNLFGDIKVSSGIINIAGDNSINNLLLDEAAELNIISISPIVLKDSLAIRTASNKQSRIVSSSSELATIEFETRRKYCIENLYIENIKVSGEVFFNLSNNSIQEGNNENISELPCDNIVFADFKMTTLCANSLLNVNNFSSGLNLKYEWEFSGDYLGVVQEDIKNPLVSYETPGQKQIKLTVSNDDNISTFTKTILIQENSLDEVELREVSAGLASTILAAEYIWIKNGEIIENENERLLSEYDKNGIYQVAYIADDHECKNRASNVLNLVLSIDDINQLADMGIHIFPNPVDGLVNIENLENNIQEIMLYDSNGRLLYSNFKVINGDIKMDFTNNFPGIYILKIVTRNNGFYNVKLIKK